MVVPWQWLASGEVVGNRGGAGCVVFGGCGPSGRGWRWWWRWSGAWGVRCACGRAMGGRMGDGVGGVVQVGKHVKNVGKSVLCSAEEAVERPRSVRPVGRHTYAVVGQDSGSRGLGVAGCGWGCSVWCRGRYVGCLCDFSCFLLGAWVHFLGGASFFHFWWAGQFSDFLGCPHFIFGGKMQVHPGPRAVWRHGWEGPWRSHLLDPWPCT